MTSLQAPELFSDPLRAAERSPPSSCMVSIKSMMKFPLEQGWTNVSTSGAAMDFQIWPKRRSRCLQCFGDLPHGICGKCLLF